MGAIAYDNDFYGWLLEQASLLRAGKFAEVDIEHLVDEVESMGRSEKRGLVSCVAVLLQHLLKWEYQAQRRSRSWELSIAEQRRRIPKLIQESPSLKPALISIVEEAYDDARAFVAAETGLPLSVFPKECPWTLATALDVDFFPERNGA